MQQRTLTADSVRRKVIAAFIVGALVGAISAVEVVPNFKGVATGEAKPDESDSFTDGSTAVPTSGPNSGQPGQNNTGSGLPTTGVGSNPENCAPGRNGGGTDQGVTATQIRMATTVVDSGIGASFLRDVRFAMEAVRTKVNRAGGICGRQLVIRYVDDGWEAQKGQQFLRNFINDPDPNKKIFAIPVAPSSEGLRVVIDSGDIERARMPVVGTDGMLIDQYLRSDKSPQGWVWSVAVATAASARIIVQDAVKKGITRFSIIFDRNYRFGQEAARAFNAEVKRQTGKSVSGFNPDFNCQLSFCGIVAGQSSYSNEVNIWRENRGQLTALFVEPQTGLTWMNDPNAPSASDHAYAAAQPLFTREFAVNCQRKCDQMSVWTGFKPFIEDYRNDAALRTYVNDLKRTNPAADEFNAFAQGGYAGMLLLVEALKKVGANLTRANLKAVLDSMDLTTGLTLEPKLSWRRNLRFAATTMQSFQIQYKGTFAGWRAGAVERDPRPTLGIE